MSAQQAYQPGQRIRVTQQIPKGDSYLVTTFEGTIVAYAQQKTGSWYAHSKDKKLWLDRLDLKMDDGEERIVNLDQYTRIETL